MLEIVRHGSWATGVKEGHLQLATYLTNVLEFGVTFAGNFFTC